MILSYNIIHILSYIILKLSYIIIYYILYSSHSKNQKQHGRLNPHRSPSASPSFWGDVWPRGNRLPGGGETRSWSLTEMGWPKVPMFWGCSAHSYAGLPEKSWGCTPEKNSSKIFGMTIVAWFVFAPWFFCFDHFFTETLGMFLYTLRDIREIRHTRSMCFRIHDTIGWSESWDQSWPQFMSGMVINHGPHLMDATPYWQI